MRSLVGPRDETRGLLADLLSSPLAGLIAIVVSLAISGTTAATALAGHWADFWMTVTGALLFVIGVSAFVARAVASNVREWLADPDDRQEATEALIDGLAVLAITLVGRRHAHLGEAWVADLFGDPEAGQLPQADRRFELATGFVIAALRCRLDDVNDLVWHPVDALLASWRGSKLVMLMPVTIAAWMIVVRDGFYGLIINAENLAVIAAAPYGTIKCLRKYRQISTPIGPEKRASSTRNPDQ